MVAQKENSMGVDFSELLEMFLDDLGYYINAVVDLLKESVGWFVF